jgi:hypothetical protein
LASAVCYEWISEMRVRLMLVLLLAGVSMTTCSLRSSERLQSGLVGGGGMAGDGGAGATGGGAGMGGSGGACTNDCDGDGECDDLLSSSDHCGVCDFSCGNEPCVLGSCVIEETEGPIGIAADDTHVFFTTGPSIYQQPLDGGDSTMFVDLLAQPWALRVDATDVYVSDFSTGVVKIPKGAPLDTQFIYVGAQVDDIDRGTLHTCWGQWEIASPPEPPRVGCAVDMNNVFTLDLSANPTGVKMVSGTLHWVQFDGDVKRASVFDLSGETRTGTVDNDGATGGIDVFDGKLYVASDTGVWTADAEAMDATLSPVLEAPQVSPYRLRVRDGYVYWTTWGDLHADGTVPGRLSRVAIGGGEEEVLYESVDPPEGRVGNLVMRNDVVYFTDYDRGRVLKRSLAAPPL